MLTTAGDSVTLVETRAALQTLLGTIDSSTEALLLAYFAGADMTCAVAEPTVYTTEARVVGDAYEVRSTRRDCATGTRVRQTFPVARDGTVREPNREVVGQEPCVVEGRRPAGLQVSAPLRADTQLGAYFASAARFEAASVFAFERLARELEQLAAPPELVAAALRSGLEESVTRA